MTRARDDTGVIRMRVLGASEIAIGRKRITPKAEVVFALGFYLCVRAGERITREEVTATFWGEGREPQGRHSLRQMLYRLRQRGFLLDEDGEELQLDPARVESDLGAALEESWVTRASAAEIEAAGQLAPGFRAELTPRFAEWMDGIRARLAAQHRRAALHQISLARQEGRWADLEKWALQVLLSDPLNEEATLARAESAAMAGSKAMALEIIDQYLEDLGDRSVQIGLPATVLRRRIAERRPEWSQRGPREVPLVGRTELMRRLTGLVDAAAGGKGRAVVLWGAPGIGKTRLAEEVRGYANLKGFRGVHLRASVSDTNLPLSVFLGLVPILRALPGGAGCDPRASGVLDRISQREWERSASDTPAAGSSLRALALEALCELIEAVTDECKVLVLLDDVHNADAHSWSVLAALMDRTSTRRLVWIATSRVQPVAAKGDEVQTATHVRSLHVPALALADAARLAEAILTTNNAFVAATDATALAVSAGGNPLFVRELTAHQARRTSGERLPLSLRELIQGRLDGMTPAMVRVLRIASLMGRHSTIARLRALQSPSEPHLSETIERLELEGVITWLTGPSLLIHECWHQCVLEDMNPATRAAISLDCAHILADASDGAGTPEASWRAAELYVAAGELGRALELQLACAEHMTSLGFPEEACTMITGSLRLARFSGDRLRLLTCLARAQHSSGDLTSVVRTCDEALAIPLVDGLQVLTDRAQLTALRTDACAKTHLDHRDGMIALAALATDARLPPETRQVACLTGMRLIANDAGSPLELHFLNASKEIASAHGLSTTGALVRLIYHAENGHLEELAQLDGLLSSLENEPVSLSLQCRTLRYRSAAARWLGNFGHASVLAERAFSLSAARGLTSEAVFSAESMTFSRLDMNDTIGARLWLARWREYHSSAASTERDQALAHATSRLHCQEDDHESAIGVYLTRLEELRRDPFPRRRGVDIATVALSAAYTGRSDLADWAIGASLAILHTERPARQIDYVAEMLLRTASLTNDATLRGEIVDRYSNRRVALNLPFPPFFGSLEQSVCELRAES